MYQGVMIFPHHATLEAMPAAVEIAKLTKVYTGGVQALSGIDLSIAEGDFFALLGPNGAGKTTTIGILSTLVRKTSGSVHIFGHDLDRDPATAKMHIGVVPQEMNFSIFETVADIVVDQAGYYGVPRPLATERAEQYLTQLGLWEKRNTPSRMLSGGMKRRLMIARALVHEPQLLILDEPTAGVDIELRRGMWTFLRELSASGKTIILTTHYLEEAEELCNRLAIIHRGALLEQGDMRAMLSTLHVQTFICDLSASLSEEHTKSLALFSPAKREDGAVEFTLKPEVTTNALFAALNGAGITVTSMRNKANRLEELFVRLTQDTV
jgi:ABC-2 type transport system ATP-binding protein